MDKPVRVLIVDNTQKALANIRKEIICNQLIEVTLDQEKPQEIKLSLKPFTVGNYRINKAINNQEQQIILKPKINADINAKVIALLHELGMTSHIKGYRYIKEGIFDIYFNPGVIDNITGLLYPKIAAHNKVSASSVEKAIRHAIEICFNRCGYNFMTKIFGHSIDSEKAKPTNSEFLAAFIDEIKNTI